MFRVFGRQLYLYQVFHVKPLLIIGELSPLTTLVNYLLTHMLPPVASIPSNIAV